jgi:hypothetical protein
MSRVVRAAGQNVSPSDDAKLNFKLFTDGLFADVDITSLGSNVVHIPALYGIMKGRDFSTDAQDINVTLPSSGTGTGYVLLRFDTSTTDVVSIISKLAPYTLQYDDINESGTICEMLLATYVASTVAVTSIANSYAIASGVSSTTVSVTLQASGWDTTNKTYTIDKNLTAYAELITATSNQEFLPPLSGSLSDDQLEALNAAKLMDYGQSAGSAVLIARGTVPTIDIPIRIIFRGSK